MSEKKEQILPIPKPRQVQVHILDESLTVTDHQNLESQPPTAGAEGTSGDTENDQRDPPAGPSTNKGKDANTHTSSCNAENTHSDSHGKLRRGAKVNDCKSDSDGIDPQIFNNSLRLNKTDSDSALLLSGAEDKVGTQEEKDNEHKGRSYNDPQSIDSGSASQIRPKSTGRQKASDVVDLQASDVVQRPKGRKSKSLLQSVKELEGQIDVNAIQQQNIKQQGEVLVQSKRVSTDNKVARYEREGNLLSQTKDLYAKIWIRESGDCISEVPVHILNESLTVTNYQNLESQPPTAGAEGTSVDTENDQRDPPTGPSTNKGKDSNTHTSSCNAENTHSDSHGKRRRGAKVNDCKSDIDGIDPETLNNSLRLNKKDSDSALLLSGAEDKVGTQEEKDNEHKGRSYNDPDSIYRGWASQILPKPTGRQKVSETEPKALLLPRKKIPSVRGDKRQSNIGRIRKTDDADRSDAGPAPVSKKLPKFVQRENKGDVDQSTMTVTDKKAFLASMIDKQASDVVDLQASDVVQRSKGRKSYRLLPSVKDFEGQIEASAIQQQNNRQQGEVLVQSKRVSTGNKVARYEREGNLQCETKDSCAKIWIRESGDRISEDMRAYLKKSNAMVTVAIDFGTTYSGCAFSVRDNPGKIYVLNFQGGASSKVPTAILYDPRRKMHSFGYEALEHYASLSSSDELSIWRLFERFKMKLFTKSNSSISKNVEITDNHGNTKLALDIFADALGYMAERIKKEIHERVPAFDDDIHWVITVPAIWSTMSRTFMRVAAKMAGIRNERLSLALEPEAAAICCKCESALEFQAGTRFMIVDIGGGTTDIAVCEVNEGTSLKELHQPSGGDFGGINVDQKFIELLIEIFGEDVLTEFKDKHTKSYIKMMADFELKKRLFKGTNTCQIKVDPILLELCKKGTGIDEVSIMKKSSLSKKFEWKFGKLILSTEIMKCFFEVAIDKILEAINCILAKVERIDSIILLGGFSESPYLCSRLEKGFPGKISKVENPVLAVLKGAVLIGRDPYAIASRVCEYTYGIAGTMKYKPHHPEKNRFYLNGVKMCDHCFYKHIEIGTEVSVHDEENAVEHEYFPTTGDQTQAILEVYASTDKDPEYIDDSCHLVGFIKVDIDPKGDFWAKILVKMFFGGTEIKVVITDVKNGKVQRGSVDFWG